MRFLNVSSARKWFEGTYAEVFKLNAPRARQDLYQRSKRHMQTTLIWPENGGQR